jgi:hypothetical protein
MGPYHTQPCCAVGFQSGLCLLRVAAYGLLLVAIWGAEWLRQPGIAEPLILALALLVLPYFVMMPGMGMRIAGSRTPKPNVTRLKSVIGHSMFGIGMYLTARLMEALG